jgi:putative transposase
MPYDPHKHRRHSIRLKGFDYTQSGAYFLTICVYEQECLFGEVVAGLMRMNNYGRIAQREWERLPARFKNIALEASVVMPNHVHGIIVIADESEGVGARQGISKTLAHNGPAVPLPDNPQNIEHFGRPVPGSIPTIVRSYKSAVSLRINRIRAMSTGPIWQRNYYEHVIRNEADLSRLRAYIQANPARWAADRLHPDT